MLKKAFNQYSELHNEIQTLKSENHKLRQENNELKNNSFINSIWSIFGGRIDAKLKKGSTYERKKLLNIYALKVQKAVSDEELKDAVNDIDAFESPKISTPRFFPCIFKTSETTKAVIQFKDDVNKYKNWETVTQRTG